MVAGVVLVIGACAGCKSEQANAEAPSKSAKAAKSKTDDSGKGVTKAAVAAGAGEAAGDKDKSKAVPGIDLGKLDPSQVAAIERLVDEKQSPCGKPQSLRASLEKDPSCKRSLFAVRYMARLFNAGFLPSEVEEIYDKRFTSPDRGECNLSDAHVRGNPKAPVTICEFADFECPHCRELEPILERVMDEYRDQVELVFKTYPLTGIHPQAASAAAAAVAAGNQGKFWQMHDKVFANQDHLTDADLQRYASELKLDVKKWKQDLPAAAAEVKKEHAEGEKLGIEGTPTLYINGRKYAGPLRYSELKDWIDEELAR